MYRKGLPFHIWLTLALSVLIAIGTGKIAEYLSAATYDEYKEERTVAKGEIGGIAGDDIPQAESVDDLLSLDRFTIIYKGISHQNDGAGFYEGQSLYNLELPSGERVAASINTDSIQWEGDYLTSDKTLPVGKVVQADLTQAEEFLNQIEVLYPLSRHDFYVDMSGESLGYSEEYRSSNYVILTQLVTVFICFPIIHSLGAKIGIFPYFFPPGRRKLTKK